MSPAPKKQQKQPTEGRARATLFCSRHAWTCFPAKSVAHLHQRVPSYKSPAHPQDLSPAPFTFFHHHPLPARHFALLIINPFRFHSVFSTFIKNASQSCRQEARRQGPLNCQQGSREEGCRQEDCRYWRKEEAIKDSQGDLQLLHLQGFVYPTSLALAIFLAFSDSNLVFSPQAGPPRHWYLQPCHVHPELVR